MTNNSTFKKYTIIFTQDGVTDFNEPEQNYANMVFCFCLFLKD